jgi:hypothetical protein
MSTEYTLLYFCKSDWATLTAKEYNDFRMNPAYYVLSKRWSEIQASFHNASNMSPQLTSRGISQVPRRICASWVFGCISWDCVWHLQYCRSLSTSYEVWIHSECQLLQWSQQWPEHLWLVTTPFWLFWLVVVSDAIPTFELSLNPPFR